MRVFAAIPRSSAASVAFIRTVTGCVTALIDRLTHHADICPIEGESYRLREAETEQRDRRAAKRP